MTDADLQVLISKVDDIKDDIDVIKDILFGESDRQVGLMVRLNRLEDRLGLFWTVAGVCGTAAIIAIMNMIINLVKG